jgi:hypothetical protein
MTLKAMIRQNRPHIAVKLNRPAGFFTSSAHDQHRQ